METVNTTRSARRTPAAGARPPRPVTGHKHDKAQRTPGTPKHLGARHDKGGPSTQRTVERIDTDEIIALAASVDRTTFTCYHKIMTC
jgi:hypothetical protein